jgi:hypothetical protein
VRGIIRRRMDSEDYGFAVSREFLVVTFDQLRHRVAGGFGHGGPGYP